MACQAAPLPAKAAAPPPRAPLAELPVNSFYDLHAGKHKKRGPKLKDWKAREAGYTEPPDVMRLERSYSRKQQIRVLDYTLNTPGCNATKPLVDRQLALAGATSSTGKSHGMSWTSSI